MVHLPIQLGLFIWVHIARFRPSGKVCAGDYLSEEQFEAILAYQVDGKSSPELFDEEEAKSYLIQEGIFLKWWVIGWWILFATLSCCLCCLYCCLLRGRDSNLHLVSTRE